MTCCDSIKDLGCFGHCEEIVTGLTATATGAHTIDILDGNYKEINFTNGNPITFENFFNEDMITIFSVRDVNGDVMLLGSDNCFQVMTKPKIAI